MASETTPSSAQLTKDQLEQAAICAVLSNVIYLPDEDPKLGTSWEQLNQHLKAIVEQGTYPSLTSALQSMRVIDGQSSFDLACFSSEESNVVYLVARGTEELFRDVLMNDIPILFTGEAGPLRLRTSFRDATRWKALHPGKDVVCSGHSLGGSIALSLVSGGISRKAHVFNFGRGVTETLTHLNFAFAHHYRDVFHHHMHGDVISPDWLTFVPTITYEPKSHIEAHSILNWTSYVEQGSWPPTAKEDGVVNTVVEKIRNWLAQWVRSAYRTLRHYTMPLTRFFPAVSARSPQVQAQGTSAGL